MRQINHIVLHCTATPQNTTIESIQAFWRAKPPKGNGWKDPGYHYIIKPDGTAVNLQPIEKPSNGVKGHNADSLHISYIGGVDAKGNAVDTRTPAQKLTQIELIIKFRTMFPNADVRGHRDFPGVTKKCPSFDVKDWLKRVGL
jgi:N-acetylmuramoyl-L-alanine amidase